MRFAFEAKQHILRNHPRCPDFAVEYFASQVADKKWKNCTLGQSVGITMQNILRHEMTEYDQLLLVGVDRRAARRRVQRKVNAMIASWQMAPPRGPDRIGSRSNATRYELATTNCCLRSNAQEMSLSREVRKVVHFPIKGQVCR